MDNIDGTLTLHTDLINVSNCVKYCSVWWAATMKLSLYKYYYLLWLLTTDASISYGQWVITARAS